MAYDMTGPNAAEVAQEEAEAKRRGLSVTEWRMTKAVTNSDGKDVVQQVVWDTIGRGTAFGPRPGERLPEAKAVVRGSGWQAEAKAPAAFDEDFARSMVSWSPEETAKFDALMAAKRKGAP
jgi:hypothetical protein